MQIKSRIVVPLIVIVVSLLLNACTKIDTTSLGQDLIPAVDDVTTFADTLEVVGEQGFFGGDSTQIGKADQHPLGSITNDPVFGKVNANLYVQLKPAFYPYYFGKPGDSISNGIPGTGFDSAVLCFSYKGYYGDSTQVQHFKVYLIDDANTNFVRDTTFPLSFVPNGGANGLGREVGSATVAPTGVRNFTYFYNVGTKKDSVNNQIRIRMSDEFLNSFVRTWDTASRTNMYYSDSLFGNKIKGFAIVPDQNQGNGIFYVNIQDATTRLEVHYRASNRGKLDTSYSSFGFLNASTATTTGSAHAVGLVRDRTGAEYNPANPPTATDVLYLQTTPGTYATLKINGLSNLPNSIVHRAELFIEQVGPITAVDKALLPPNFLYLDLNDTAIKGNPYKPIYYDLNPSATYYPDISTSTIFFPTSGMDTAYFGGGRYSREEPGGTRHFYKFTITRYVQKIVTLGEKNYPLRLSAPYDLYYYNYTLPFRNSIAAGRIKIGNGNNPNPAYRMGLRVVYSKI